MGHGLIAIEGPVVHLLAMGVLKLSGKKSNYDRLQLIHEQVTGLIQQYRPDEFAIEAPFFGKNVQSMLKLGRAQGVAIAAAMTAGLPVTEYSPKKVKQSITGNGNADKEQVWSMLRQLLDLSEKPKHYDATDALAVALCHHYQRRTPLPAGSASHKKTKTTKSGWERFIRDNPNRVR